MTSNWKNLQVILTLIQIIIFILVIADQLLADLQDELIYYLQYQPAEIQT